MISWEQVCALKPLDILFFENESRSNWRIVKNIKIVGKSAFVEVGDGTSSKILQYTKGLPRTYSRWAKYHLIPATAKCPPGAKKMRAAIAKDLI